MQSSKMTTSVLALSGLMISANAEAECKKFSDVYTLESIKEFWGDSFVVPADDSKAYDMWFPNASSNPNDALTQELVANGTIMINNDTHFNDDGIVDKCYLNSCHKDEDEHVDNAVHPEEDPADFTICSPWAERSCCSHEAVSEIEAMRDQFRDWYGAGHCGGLSDACEDFFVQEQCFYACSPNAGLYRKYRSSEDAADVGNGAFLHNASDDDHNEWQIFKMPMKSSWFAAFHAACSNDHICVHSGDWNMTACGDFMPPSNNGTTDDTTLSPTTTSASDPDLSGAACASAVTALAATALALLA